MKRFGWIVVILTCIMFISGCGKAENGSFFNKKMPNLDGTWINSSEYADQVFIIDGSRMLYIVDFNDQVFRLSPTDGDPQPFIIVADYNLTNITKESDGYSMTCEPRWNVPLYKNKAYIDNHDYIEHNISIKDGFIVKDGEIVASPAVEWDKKDELKNYSFIDISEDDFYRAVDFLIRHYYLTPKSSTDYADIYETETDYVDHLVERVREINNGAEYDSTNSVDDERCTTLYTVGIGFMLIDPIYLPENDRTMAKAIQAYVKYPDAVSYEIENLIYDIEDNLLDAEKKYEGSTILFTSDLPIIEISENHFQINTGWLASTSYDINCYTKTEEQFRRIKENTNNAFTIIGTVTDVSEKTGFNIDIIEVID